MTVDFGEDVEDVDFGNQGLDWGDAPDDPATPQYPTLAVNNGASHQVIPGGLILGTSIDAENDGQPDPNALGDDNAGVPDDEDGITFTSPLGAGGAGVLNAWVDFNQDEDWDDLGEQIFTD